MPNQYKNKVVYGDSVLMDITDTTAEAGDVASGAVFYAKNGARTVGTFVQAQSDWVEDDTTDPAFILNRTHYKESIGNYGEIDLSYHYTKLTESSYTDSVISKTYSYKTTSTSCYSTQVNGFPNFLTSDFDTSETSAKININGVEYTLTQLYVPGSSESAVSYFYYYNDDVLAKVGVKSTYLDHFNVSLYTNFVDDIDIPNVILYAPSSIENYHYYTLDNRYLDGVLPKRGLAYASEVFNEQPRSAAKGLYSHAEGRNIQANGSYAHAEGVDTKADGTAPHAEGYHTWANNLASHAEGQYGLAFSDGAHVEGSYSYSLTLSITLTGEANATTYTVVDYDSDKDIIKNPNLLIGYYCSAKGARIIDEVRQGGVHRTITLDKTLNAAEAITEQTFTFYCTNAAYGQGSHAEGIAIRADGAASHAEGYNTSAIGIASHAEGRETIAKYDNQHVQGKYNLVDPSGLYAGIVGNGTSDSARSNAYTLDWSGNGWFAGKVSAGTTASPASVTDANDLTTKQYVDNAVASAQVQSDWNETDTTDSAYILNKPPVIAGEADGSIVSGKLDPAANTVYTLTITGDANSNVFTYTTEDTLPSSASLRVYGLAHYLKSSTDVYKTITKLDATNHLITLSGAIDATSAITNGTLTIYYQQHLALGQYSQAEGQYTYTTGTGAHAEGGGTKALGQNSHAEGYSSVAEGAYSHAEGNESLAKGTAAHAEGGSNIAVGRYSHTEGYGNVAASDYQHVHGKYNTEDSNMTYVDIVGNGTSSNHSNAYTLDWSGNGWFAGKVTVGADPAGSMDVATKQYVDSNFTPTVLGSTNTDDSDYISPAWAILYITDAPRNLIMSHIDNVYGQLFFNSWNVALSAGLIVSNAVLYNGGLLCATLIGNGNADAWIFTVYPIQETLTIDTAMSSTSTNPVQNKVIQGALDGKVNTVSGKGLSTNDYTTAEKNKLAGIQAGAQVNPTIDTVMSSSSTNPVTNSAITTAIANSKGKIFYGQVDSTSTATAFTAQIPGIAAYEEGLVVILKNGVVTSASGFTININGLGALPAYTNLGAESRETTIFNVAYTMMFVYENRVSGGNWLCYRGSDANTNTIGYQLRTNSMSLPMKSVTYRYRLLFTSADGAHFVPANNTTSTNATASRAVCQDKIDPFGPIYYYGTTASVGANSRPSATYLWEQYTVSLGYSFNRTGAALTLSSWEPVYVKCAPQADGSAIMDATTPYVQDLPTTADGKIYIFLGVAYSATNIELVSHHPVYCYRNGGIQEWTGVQAEIDALTARINNLIDGDEVSY